MKGRNCLGTIVILVLFLSSGLSAGDNYVRTHLRGKFSLERLHSRPFIFGTSPKMVKWTRDGSKIAFLWNNSGDLFFDLWMATVPDGKLIRLTEMKSVPAIPIEDETRPEDEIREAESYNPGVQDFDWSPDGRSVAFSYRNNLFLLPADGGKAVRRIIRSLEGEAEPRFSPDGKTITFLMKNNLWAYSLEDGSLSQLTTLQKPDLLIQGYYWSPGADKIAIITTDISSQKEIDIPDYVPHYVKLNKRKRSYVGESATPTRIGLIPRQGGLIKWLEFEKPLYVSYIAGGNPVMSWAPTGNQFLVNYMDTFRDWKIYVVDSDSLAKKEVYVEHQEPYYWEIFSYWSPEGDRIYFTSEKTGWRHIYSIPSSGGAATQLTDGNWDVLSFLNPGRGDRLVFSSSQVHPLEQYLFSVDSHGGKIVQLTNEKGSTSEWLSIESLSPDGKYTVINFSNIQNPTEYYLVDNSAPGSLKRITHSPLPEFGDLYIPEPRYFTYQNKEDGRTIHGFMQVPRNFKKDKRYPVVIANLYADSAKNRWVTLSGMTVHERLVNFYMINELDYIIVSLDLPASEGYGKDFRYSYYRNLGVIDVKDLAGAAGYLKGLPYVDGGRIGIWGRSYGGFLTIMSMCMAPGVFNSGVALAPVTDWHNYNDIYTGQRLGRPQGNEEIYKKTSPVYQVDGLRGNLLIMHGMQDSNVLFQDTVQIVQKLIKAGKYFDLMIYPLEDHMFTATSSAWPDVFKRLVKYFEDHMGVGPR